jgi:cytochrome c2
VQTYGCGSCHVVPGVSGANGKVGPPLTDFGQRSYVAGLLPNNADNLQHWIRDPQQVLPGNAMPDLGVTQVDAQDIAAYLLTLGR